MRIYCMYDSVAEEAGTIFEARNDAMARRAFSTINPESLPPGSTKEDFRLFKLGSFFRGNDTERPCVKGFAKAYDITNGEAVLAFGDKEIEQNEAV